MPRIVKFSAKPKKHLAKKSQRNVDAGNFSREPEYATHSEAKCCILRRAAENFKIKSGGTHGREKKDI